MADKTGIEWTDATWSPIRVRVREDAAAIAEAKGYGSLVQIAGKVAGRVGPHCEHVSPGCAHCYAETNNHRCLPANGTGLPYDRRSRDLVEAFVDETILLQPLRWKRPRKIFVENQSDIFGEWVTDAMLDRVFAVMALCPQHEFQILTKRPERMPVYFDDRSYPGFDDRLMDCLYAMDAADPKLKVRAAHSPFMKGECDWGPLPNVWLGVSAEDQKTADERIPLLLQTPAAVRFVSAEPMLGLIDIARYMPWIEDNLDPADYEGALFCTRCMATFNDHHVCSACLVDWVICGGESGRDASPMHPDWARSLRDQCVAAGMPFFFKQWGENLPYSQVKIPEQREAFSAATKRGKQSYFGACIVPGPQGMITGATAGVRPESYADIGKKVAGHLLDGVEWHQFPER